MSLVSSRVPLATPYNHCRRDKPHDFRVRSRTWFRCRVPKRRERRCFDACERRNADSSAAILCAYLETVEENSRQTGQGKGKYAAPALFCKDLEPPTLGLDIVLGNCQADTASSPLMLAGFIPSVEPGKEVW